MNVQKTIPVVTPTNHRRSKPHDGPIRIILTITSNLLKAREKSRVKGAIGFGFASHWFQQTTDFSLTSVFRLP